MITFLEDILSEHLIFYEEREEKYVIGRNNHVDIYFNTKNSIVGIYDRDIDVFEMPLLDFLSRLKKIPHVE